MVCEVAERRLLGQGFGVVDCGGDAFFVEGGAELVSCAGEGAQVNAAGVEVPSWVGAFGWDWAVDACDGVDAVVVDVGDFAAAVGFGGEGFEFGEADGAGDVVHAVVEADGGVEVLVGFAVGAEGADGVGKVLVVDGDHSAFTSAEVFGGVEGVGACVAESAEAFVFVFGEVCLGAVVDDFEVVLFGECFDGVDVYGDAVEVGDGDGFGVWGDLLFDVGWVGLVGVFEGVAEDDFGACGDEHGDGCDVGPCWCDDFVTAFEECAVGELECGCAVGAGEADLGIGFGGELFFECGAFGGGSEHSGFEDFVCGGDVFFGESYGHEWDIGFKNWGSAVDGEV